MQQTNFFLNKIDAHILFKNIILPRKIEEKMLKLLRQNKISKWFSGMGQEAIPVGVASALKPEDHICTMHRNLGIFTTRNVPLYPLFCQLLGKKDGFSEGRDRSFHFGIPEYNIIGMISHLGAMLPVANGLALASKMSGENYATLAFCGEGSTSEGDFHEALNLAAVWGLPVIFLIENNGYALSTPIKEQFACDSIVSKADGYGIKGVQIDGNNIVEVYDQISSARDYVLNNQKPILVEAMTFRMRGHEEASGTAYIPKELFAEWKKKDPILVFRKYLIENGLLNEDKINEIEKEAEAVFLPDLERALSSEDPVFDEATERNRVFIPYEAKKPDSHQRETIEGRYIDGITRALEFACDENEKTLVIGQDIAEYGGAFKVTNGFLEKYGRNRVRNTPIIESGAVGTAIGLSLKGYRPILEMQFADFISCGFNQIINNLAKSHYRWGAKMNVTIRSPYGAGVGAGPFHSQSPENWFMQHSGLKIAVPATVEDALNLTWSAILDPNPVLIFEHKKLYRSLKGDLPTHPVAETLGKAAIRRNGDDATIITYGMGVHWALAKAEQLSKENGIELTVVDLRTLVPLDFETIKEAVQKTGRVLLLEEAMEVLGPMSEISALISEHCFESLDAPVIRCSSINTPVPFNRILEDGYLAVRKLDEKLKWLLDY